MGFLKTRREAKRLRAKAEADPAIRDGWVRLHDTVFVGFQFEGVKPYNYEPRFWRDVFGEFEGRVARRQELEWWRAMCVGRQSVMCPGGWLPAIAAMTDAIDAMLPEAADGPGSERYP